MATTANPISADRAIIHVDMDAFFASVEQLDQPQYRRRPVIVGGAGRRGVVAAASYEVRRYGVHSAMPMGQARRLCPDAVILPVRMARYREVSAQVFAVFHVFTPQVEGLSLDEAFLDVSGSLALFGSIEKIGAMLRGEIHARTGLHASVGMAHNKFLAKLASDIGKPRGFVHVAPGGVRDFLDPMPAGRIWGIGRQTLPKLRKLGILTIGQLRRADPLLLSHVLGRQAAHFQALARGEDDREVIPARPDKSMSREMTFEDDVTSARQLSSELQRQAESVCARLRKRHLLARTIRIKVRDARFRTATRSRSLAEPTSSTQVVYRQARTLLEAWLAEHRNTPVRLLGLGLSGLEQSGGQGGPYDARRQSKLDETLDAIRKKYGDDKATRALALKNKPG